MQSSCEIVFSKNQIHAGDEEEEQHINVSTTKGYEQIVSVWDARDDVEAVLGRRAWKKLFPAMSEGRLTPTPWLNKVAQTLAASLNRVYKLGGHLTDSKLLGQAYIAVQGSLEPCNQILSLCPCKSKMQA